MKLKVPKRGTGIEFVRVNHLCVGCVFSTSLYFVISILCLSEAMLKIFANDPTRAYPENMTANMDANMNVD